MIGKMLCRMGIHPKMHTVVKQDYVGVSKGGIPHSDGVLQILRCPRCNEESAQITTAAGTRPIELTYAYYVLREIQ